MSIRHLALLTAVGLVLTLRPINTYAQSGAEELIYPDDAEYGESYEYGQPTCDCYQCRSRRGCSKPGCGNGCGNRYGNYFDVRVGGMSQRRSTFRLGKITEDSNDLPAGQHVTYAEPGFEFGGEGVNVELVAGENFNSRWGIEWRFAYASLDERGNFALDDLSGIPFEAGSGGFWVPFIDASTPEHARGIFGMRVRNNIDVDYTYDSNWYDFGADFICHLANNNCGRIDLVVGPSFANIDQEIRHVTRGDWNGPEQTSSIREALNEWFYGAKFALRSEQLVAPQLSLVGGLTAHAYYHDASFDGSQFLDTAGALDSTYDVEVSDGAENFAARLGLEAGFNYQVDCNLSIGFLYRLDSWHNVSAIVNPDLTLVEDDGDNRWAGDRASYLVDDQAVTQAFLATIEWRR